MAVELNSLNINRHFSSTSPRPPSQPSSSLPSADAFPADQAAENQHSSRKVKLLCSFGGKILPRPSDGALRYAGGHTRIIVIRRGASLTELYRKMAEVYCSPVAIRYQLPDEDLDALITVSSAEDLENMMDEYDKLTEASVDGSAKLRVFLFSPSELALAMEDNSSAGPGLVDLYENEQKYIEAVNGYVASDVGKSNWKESTVSFSASHNLDAGIDGTKNVGIFPAVSSSALASAYFDPSSLHLAGCPPISMPLQETFVFPVSSTAVSHTTGATQPLKQFQVGTYASHVYAEPHQIQCIPRCSLAMATAPEMSSVAAVPQHAYLPPLNLQPGSIPLQVGSVNQVQGKMESCLDEDHFDGRTVQPFSDHGCKGLNQPLSQLPPLHHSHLQKPDTEQYRVHQVPPLPRGLVRFENCQMCQKTLPHAHSDTHINEQCSGSRLSHSNAHPPFCNHYSENTIMLQGLHKAISVAKMENFVESTTENTMKIGQYGPSELNNVADLILDKEKAFMPNVDEFDLSGVRHQLNAVSLSGDTQASYGALINNQHLQLDHFSQPQQKLALHGDNFAKKISNPTVTLSLSGSDHVSHGVSNSLPQTCIDDPLQQQNLGLDKSSIFSKALHTNTTTFKPSTFQISNGVSLCPPQPHHEGFLQQQLLLPPFSESPLDPVKQEVICNCHSKGKNSTNNVNCHDLKLLNHDVSLFSEAHVKQVDGAMQVPQACTFENLVSSNHVKPAGPLYANSHIDLKPERLSMATFSDTSRLQNDSNASVSSNAFMSRGADPEEVSFKPVNPLISNIGISRKTKPENPSVVESDNKSILSHYDGGALLSSNASMLPVNTIVSKPMDLEKNELATACLVSTVVGSTVSLSQNFETDINRLLPNQGIVGMPSYNTGPAYISCISNNAGRNWQDETAGNFIDTMAASRSGNVPIPLPSSNYIPILVEQFPEKFMSGSFFCSQDPPEILGPANEYCPKPDIVARGESNFCVDNSTEKQLQRDKDPDMVISSGDRAHEHPVGSWNKESCSIANITMKDFIKQDLDDLPEREVESVVRSFTPPASVMPSTEPMHLSPPVGKSAKSEDGSSSHSETVLGDQKIAENRLRQLDLLNKVLPIANDIGRLQIIKNIDLEELQELGSGTFGTVYYGKWRGSDVAIKRINNRCFAGKSAEEEKMRADFWNEASKLADLHHPNVLAFYGVVLDGPGGSFATVTEYMINGSLRNALHQNDREFDQWRRLLIAMDVAFGMEYLHGKNIVHFDLKSDNLLVNLRDPQRPICKVGDLGLSKVKCQTLISGGVRGTLPWMAPELLNGSSNLVSEKVDVFSFGIVMWEILTGHEPYSDLHYGTIIGGIVSNTLRPEVPESCDPEWRALMELCWAAEPSERPSFTEIANRLRSMAAALQKEQEA